MRASEFLNEIREQHNNNSFNLETKINNLLFKYQFQLTDCELFDNVIHPVIDDLSSFLCEYAKRLNRMKPLDLYGYAYDDYTIEGE